MATLIIRNFDEQLKALLRVQAARHGCSMEQEARNILRAAVQVRPTGSVFARNITRHFADLVVDELPIPARRPARLPTLLDDAA
jgi:plasmid stability protein